MKMKIEINDIDRALEICETNLTMRERRFLKLLIQVSIDAMGRIDPATNDIDISKRSWPIRSSLHREIAKELEQCGIHF